MKSGLNKIPFILLSINSFVKTDHFRAKYEMKRSYSIFLQKITLPFCIQTKPTCNHKYSNLCITKVFKPCSKKIRERELENKKKNINKEKGISQKMMKSNGRIKMNKFEKKRYT